MSTLQKNQHYVWRHYLLAWATDEKVWCVRAPSTKAFNANVKNVGSETFFYRVPELTRPDVIYLEHLISRATDPRLQDLNRGWLHDFQLTYRLRRNLELDTLDPAVRAELARALDEIEKTISERHHGALEDRAVPILDQLRQGDASFYATVGPAQTFINYLAHQYFRTGSCGMRQGAVPACGVGGRPQSNLAHRDLHLRHECRVELRRPAGQASDHVPREPDDGPVHRRRPAGDQSQRGARDRALLLLPALTVASADLSRRAGAVSAGPNGPLAV